MLDVWGVGRWLYSQFLRAGLSSRIFDVPRFWMVGVYIIIMFKFHLLSPKINIFKCLEEF